MKTITLVTGERVDTGCWIDGHWGWRGSLRVIEIAEGFGFDQKITADDRKAIEAFENNDEVFFPENSAGADPAEWVIGHGGLADDAEAFLNRLTPEGWSFGWFEGEFFLWSQADWEDAY